MPQQPRQIEQFWKNFTMNCFLGEHPCRSTKQKKMFLCRFCKIDPPKSPLSGRLQRSVERPIERTHKFTWGNSVRLLPYLSPFGGQRGCPTSSVSFSFQRTLARGTRALSRNLACVARLNLWGVEWRGDLVDLASKSHRVIRVVT